ncbi:MAG TPA: ATPase domain-containing protein [Chloroflexota bacterium]|jgi:circadian clock protein KaiC
MSSERMDEATGVPGLDVILGGGLLRRGMVCLVGGPGTGKTVLAQQMAFAAAQAGRPALYFSGLSEPHERLIEHLRAFRFFDEGLLAQSVQLLSLTPALEQDEDEAVDMVVQTVRRTGATLLILDGFGSMRRMLQNERETIRFIYRLSTQLGLLGALLIVIVEGDPSESTLYPELAASDVLIGLHYERTRVSHRRYVEVLKRRGAAPLPGLHPFTINTSGITCYPQLESVLPSDDVPFDPAVRAPFDLPELDAMLAGGLTQQTTTLLAGNQGTGKTLLGLQFLAAGVARGEPGLLVGLRETPAQLVAKAGQHGISLADAVERGTIRLLVQPPVALDPDILAWQLRDAMTATHARRVVIDSVAELEEAVAPQRAHDYLAALVTLLRAEGITAILIRETFGAFGEVPAFDDEPAAVLAENVIWLRQLQARGELRRVLAVVRMRFSSHDRTIREFTVTERGLTMLGRWSSEASLLDDLAGEPSRPLASSSGEPPR